MKQVAERGDQREQAVYSWLRYLVGLAAGALAILVSLGSGASSDIDRKFHRVALISLALGILLGSIRLYAEVWFARGRESNAAAQLKQALSGAIDASTLYVPPMPFAKTCERLCYVFLVVALLSLIALAWTPAVAVATH
jgi:hypothetical protein